MKRSYEVETIRDVNYHTSRRRKIVVQMRLTKTPNNVGESSAKTETFKVEYTAYGEDHFPAAVRKHPGGGILDHLASKAIAHEIKKYID